VSKASDNVASSIYEPFITGKGRRNINSGVITTRRIQNFYERILMELCINRFDWTGITDDPKVGISVRFMELTLMRFGLSVVFKENTTGKIIAMQGTPSGQMNWIQDPISFSVVGPLFGMKTLKADNCVPVWANFMRRSDMDIVSIYSQRLAELDMSIIINSKNARRTRVAFTNENQKLSMTNINRQIDEGTALVTLNMDQYSGETMANVLGTIDLGVDPDTITNLHILRTRIWGECMGMLGFDFANQDKKERLVAAEVDANNSQVDGMRFVNLNARKEAAMKINRKYGTNIDVDYHITTETSKAAADAMPNVGGFE
jgi:hypothetical protein